MIFIKTRAQTLNDCYFQTERVIKIHVDLNRSQNIEQIYYLKFVGKRNASNWNYKFIT